MMFRVHVTKVVRGTVSVDCANEVEAQQEAYRRLDDNDRIDWQEADSEDVPRSYVTSVEPWSIGQKLKSKGEL